ncbi:MAG: hypothetical protein HOB13_03465 [Lentimicrobiaceae bacterium]|nr:hypothetical protein [Lentimicrobiaceae bacterium]
MHIKCKDVQSSTSVDLSKFGVVFCDSLQALEWAYNNGLPRSAVIKSSAPAVLLSNKKNIYNVESRWTSTELNKFQNSIPGMSKELFNVALGVTGIERELALSVSNFAYHFQKIIYKSSCLEEGDFNNPRLFIYTKGECGPAGNIMNSPWDKLIKPNALFSTVQYTLKNDKWSLLTTQGVSYWQRFKVAGYETIFYRLIIKIMKFLPDWMFAREVIMPNENELNIEIAYSLIFSRVKITEAKLETLPDSKNLYSDKNTVDLYKAIFPIMCKRIEEWVTPSAVEVTKMLFKSHFEKHIEKFNLLVDAWDRSIVSKDNIKQAVLVNAPGNIKGHSLSFICRKKDILLMSSQHGVTIEISKAHNILDIIFDNSVADVMFSYNSKIVDIEKKIYFNNARHHIVGMPMRLIRMKSAQTINRSTPSFVYISTNLYHMGFTEKAITDYEKAIFEKDIIIKVLSEIPHKVRYKTYPEDNRRYADEDPVLKNIRIADNIELFSNKIDMRYLISEHSVFITTGATSTLGWVVMSGKPVVFINQEHNSPLTKDAQISISNGIFVFNNNDKNFHKKLKDFLSQSVDDIERLWQKKKSAREEMIQNYFSEYKGGAGGRAAKIILKEYLN